MARVRETTTGHKLRLVSEQKGISEPERPSATILPFPRRVPRDRKFLVLLKSEHVEALEMIQAVHNQPFSVIIRAGIERLAEQVGINMRARDAPDIYPPA